MSTPAPQESPGETRPRYSPVLLQAPARRSSVPPASSPQRRPLPPAHHQCAWEPLLRSLAPHPTGLRSTEYSHAATAGRYQNRLADTANLSDVAKPDYRNNEHPPAGAANAQSSRATFAGLTRLRQPAVELSRPHLSRQAQRGQQSSAWRASAATSGPTALRRGFRLASDGEPQAAGVALPSLRIPRPRAAPAGNRRVCAAFRPRHRG